MKRTDFAKIIKIVSIWKIDGRLGDYRLPTGQTINSYIDELISDTLSRYNAVITSDGDIHVNA